VATPPAKSRRVHPGEAALAGLLYVLAVLAGLVCAVVVVLNLHIVVGLEDGYAASPSDVRDRSWVLAAADVLLLAAAPVLAVVVLARARRR
jgi:hypothetical protein